MNEKKEYASLGEFLKDYRLDHSMTQEQFSEKIGITRTRYVRIENGKAKAGIATIEAIAKITKKTAAYIRGLNQKTK